jgi:hypothetical protein
MWATIKFFLLLISITLGSIPAFARPNLICGRQLLLPFVIGTTSHIYFDAAGLHDIYQPTMWAEYIGPTSPSTYAQAGRKSSCGRQIMRGARSIGVVGWRAVSSADGFDVTGDWWMGIVLQRRNLLEQQIISASTTGKGWGFWAEPGGLVWDTSDAHHYSLAIPSNPNVLIASVWYTGGVYYGKTDLLSTVSLVGDPVIPATTSKSTLFADNNVDLFEIVVASNFTASEAWVTQTHTRVLQRIFR